MIKEIIGTGILTGALAIGAQTPATAPAAQPATPAQSQSAQPDTTKKTPAGQTLAQKKQADKANEVIKNADGSLSIVEGKFAGIQISAPEAAKKGWGNTPKEAEIGGIKATLGNDGLYHAADGKIVKLTQPTTMKMVTSQAAPAPQPITPTVKENVDSLVNDYITKIDRRMQNDTTVKAFQEKYKATKTKIDSLENTAATLETSMAKVLTQNYTDKRGNAVQYWKGIQNDAEGTKLVQTVYKTLGYDVDASGKIQDQKTKSAVKAVNDRADPKNQNKKGQSTYGTDSRSNLDKIVKETTVKLKEEAAKTRAGDYNKAWAENEYKRALLTEKYAGEAIKADQKQTAKVLLIKMHDEMLGKIQNADPSNNVYQNTEKRINAYLSTWDTKDAKTGMTGAELFAKEAGKAPAMTEQTAGKTSGKGVKAFFGGLKDKLLTTQYDGARAGFSAALGYEGQLNENATSQAEGISTTGSEHSIDAKAALKLGTRADLEARFNQTIDPSTDKYTGITIGENLKTNTGFMAGIRGYLNKFVSGFAGIGYAKQSTTTDDKIIGQKIEQDQSGAVLNLEATVGNQGVGKQPTSVTVGFEKPLDNTIYNPAENTSNFGDQASGYNLKVEANTPTVGNFVQVKNGIVQNILDNTFASYGLKTGEMTNENIKQSEESTMHKGSVSSGYTIPTKAGPVTIRAEIGGEAGKQSQWYGNEPKSTDLRGFGSVQAQFNFK